MHLSKLQQIVSRGESEKVEFKKTTGQKTEAVKTVCAMLNGLGGYVLFGVSDLGEILGQQVTAKTLEDISLTLQRIEPPIFPEVETIELKNGRVVILIRVSGKMGTYCYDNRPFVRHGPTTKAMPRDEYERRVVEKLHAHRRWENEFAPDWVTIADLEEEEIQVTLKNAIQLCRMKQPTYIDSESILRGLGLIEKGHLINAAVALYGKSERLFSSYPQLSLRIARFRGSDRLSGIQDNREYWGHAFNLLSRSEQFLLDNVPISSKIISGKIVREDYPLYPPLATREAIANAICHRDYITPGGAVAVAMYDQKLEIINPGEFHFDITPEKLIKPHESKPWNPIIANVFYRAGIIERWGMGTLNIIEMCEKNKNPIPVWETRAQSVVTTFSPTMEFEPKMRPESRPESLELEILKLLRKTAMSKSQLAENLGHKQISGRLKKVLSDLLAKKKIAFTIPEKPGSRLQKYQLLEKDL